MVAQDGSSECRTIEQGVEAASSQQEGRERFVIYVNTGLHKEPVAVKQSNLMLVADGIGKSIITGSENVAGGSTSCNSATYGENNVQHD